MTSKFIRVDLRPTWGLSRLRTNANTLLFAAPIQPNSSVGNFVDIKSIDGIAGINRISTIDSTISVNIRAFDHGDNRVSSRSNAPVVGGPRTRSRGMTAPAHPTHPTHPTAPTLPMPTPKPSVFQFRVADSRHATVRCAAPPAWRSCIGQLQSFASMRSTSTSTSTSTSALPAVFAPLLMTGPLGKGIALELGLRAHGGRLPVPSVPCIRQRARFFVSGRRALVGDQK